MQCEFKYATSYRCKVSAASIAVPATKVEIFEEIERVHMLGLSDLDVEILEFSNVLVEYVPKDLHVTFPNLVGLIFDNCGLKRIEGKDIENFEKLKLLEVKNCKLRTLPDDLFENAEEILNVNFSNNEIEFLSSKFLAPIYPYRINLLGNKSINLSLISRYRGNLKDKENMIAKIDMCCSSPSNETEVTLPRAKSWEDCQYSNVKIVCGEKKFPVHMRILSTQSPIFAQIYEEVPGVKEIPIREFSESSVEQMLCFLYTGALDESRDSDPVEDFKIAAKYGIAEMMKRCEEVLLDKVTDENAMQFFLVSHEYSLENMKRKAFEKICESFPVKLCETAIDKPEQLKNLIDARALYAEAIVMMSKSRE